MLMGWRGISITVTPKYSHQVGDSKSLVSIWCLHFVAYDVSDKEREAMSTHCIPNNTCRTISSGKRVKINRDPHLPAPKHHPLYFFFAKFRITFTESTKLTTANPTARRHKDFATRSAATSLPTPR
jgi:hypothetical protein